MTIVTMLSNPMVPKLAKGAGFAAATVVAVKAAHTDTNNALKGVDSDQFSLALAMSGAGAGAAVLAALLMKQTPAAIFNGAAVGAGLGAIASGAMGFAFNPAITRQ